MTIAKAISKWKLRSSMSSNSDRREDNLEKVNITQKNTIFPTKNFIVDYSECTDQLNHSAHI